MRSKLRILLILLLVIAGIVVTVYPSLSNYVNTLHGSYAIQALSDQVERTNSEELDRQRRLAEAYNSALTGVMAEAGENTAQDGYDDILDFGNGIMGYIQIPKINVKLSIYHGVSEAVLQKGVGHMPESAFPIGGSGNHAVLTGHTGLPSAELFTNLTELAKGDLFYITVLDETLAYQVDQINVVLPYEVNALVSEGGKDYCTLVTCTPYGINTHRLLVRGERVPLDEEIIVGQTAMVIGDGVKVPLELKVAAVAVTALLAAAFLVLIPRKRGKYERRK